ncbi:hypothetical protein [Streptomyces triculaminicus]|uniref:hypothetical protein n=1 Tax=Streptomyces triculaminicus TaxID=2816232 RepID=UPI0037CD24A2
MKVFPKVHKGIRAHVNSHEQPCGIKTKNGYFYMLGLYGDLAHLLNVITVGVSVPTDGGGVDEPAGAFTT